MMEKNPRNIFFTQEVIDVNFSFITSTLGNSVIYSPNSLWKNLHFLILNNFLNPNSLFLVTLFSNSVAFILCPLYYLSLYYILYLLSIPKFFVYFIYNNEPYQISNYYLKFFPRLFTIYFYSLFLIFVYISLIIMPGIYCFSILLFFLLKGALSCSWHESAFQILSHRYLPKKALLCTTATSCLWLHQHQLPGVCFDVWEGANFCFLFALRVFSLSIKTSFVLEIPVL